MRVCICVCNRIVGVTRVWVCVGQHTEPKRTAENCRSVPSQPECPTAGVTQIRARYEPTSTLTLSLVSTLTLIPTSVTHLSDVRALAAHIRSCHDQEALLVALHSTQAHREGQGGKVSVCAVWCVSHHGFLFHDWILNHARFHACSHWG